MFCLRFLPCSKKPAALWALITLGVPLACMTDVPPQNAPPAEQRISAVAATRPEAPPAAALAKNPRNVILVTIDTLRADYLGSYGGPARTPHIDGLAAKGWQFNECTAATMLTTPTHASLMTSLYPRDHGVYDNESGIHDGMQTLAGALKHRGVQTGAVIGFPHLNPNVSNLGQGFEHIVPATRQERRADETSKAALSVVDAMNPARPFFLWIHYVDPHAPYSPDEKHPARTDSVAGSTPMRRAVRAAPGFQKNNPWFKRVFSKVATTETLVQRYVAEIEATDSGIGDLLKGLESRGLGDTTALVLTSDHGENMGEHDLYFHHGGLYRETVHVPLIISAASMRPQNFDQLVHTVDIAPTILDFFAAPRWEPMRGHSLLAIVEGRRGGRRHVFSEHMMGQLISVRSAQGTLILHRKTTDQFPTYVFKSGRQEFYDRAQDPDEQHSLAPENAAFANDLDSAMQQYMGLGMRLSARPAAGQDRESLRALGYLQ